ncbi:MAG TPA: nitrate reductase [Tepidisphaeraceae bacterium]|jgi:sulfite reductase (NADPH) flavoprotein alpha-component
MANHIKTLCPYCGVGCGIIADTDGSRLLRVRGDPDHPANFGKLCPKGASVAQTVNTPTRLRYAMRRDDLYDDLTICPSHSAVRETARRLDQIIQQHGPGAVAFYLSGQLTIESQYLANKFAKAYLRTNHVDSNSRLCMASAASGMNLSLGSDGPPTCYEDIDLAETYLFVGSNAAECHPMLFDRAMVRVRKGKARSIVVDPRKTATAQEATLHLPIKPGTDLALMNGLLRLLRDAGCIDREFVAKHTEGWEELNTLMEEYPPAVVARVCDIAADDLIAAANILRQSDRLLTFWTMGVNQTTRGTFTSNAIINLHLATGRIGKPGCGPFSLTGQPNAMGGRDCGYMSHTLPGYRFIANADHRRQMEQLWGLSAGSLVAEPGYDAVRMFDAMAAGEIKAIWIIGTNPAASMPNLPRVRAALEAAELVIVQDAYFPTETTRYAHIVLPAAVNVEQDGTFCNSERRVTLMSQVVPPPGDAMPDWWWIKQVAAAMGFTAGLRHENAAAIFDEFARTTAGRPNDQSAMHYDLLRAKGPQQWPYPAMGRSADRRYQDGRFPTPSGKARFWARPYDATPARAGDISRSNREGEAPAEPGLSSDVRLGGSLALPLGESQPCTRTEFPLVLTTGRVLNQWHTRTKSGNVEQLNKLDPAPYVQIHPDDAAELGVRDGQRIWLRSPRGQCAAGVARLDPAIRPGTVFVPIHWNELWSPAGSPNEATTPDADPISKQPALKYCAVRISTVPSEAGIPSPLSLIL